MVHFDDDFGDGGFLIILVMVDFYEVFDDILKICSDPAPNVKL